MSNLTTRTANAVPLIPVSADDWPSKLNSDQSRDFIRRSGFRGQAGQHAVVPDGEGGIQCVLFAAEEGPQTWSLAQLAAELPEGDYAMPESWDTGQRQAAALGWALAGYRFDRYTDKDAAVACLQVDETTRTAAGALAVAQNLVRDLVNTPTDDMGPDHLEAAVREQAEEFGATLKVISGDELLEQNYPAIHAVGRASHKPPRLIELNWGRDEDPRLALVGKGVCFDTGGLNIKGGSGMSKMKKDMGGAAHVLALARLVMEHELPVRLQLLIPAVENAIAGNAYRPGDVVATRKGLSVEIGNTDAEGRVILSDALTYASESDPDFILDFATLTGAARIGLGADLPPVFGSTESTRDAIVDASRESDDPMWPLPLWQPYRELLSSDIADVSNNASSSYGGCITAALFLQHFVEDDDDWVHIDTYAWNDKNRPGRPKGGEALGLRACFQYLQDRYA